MLEYTLAYSVALGTDWFLNSALRRGGTCFGITLPPDSIFEKSTNQSDFLLIDSNIHVPILSYAQCI